MSNINEEIYQKNERIKRKFLMSIDEDSELLSKPQQEENENISKLKNSISSGINFLDEEGFFRNSEMKNAIQDKIMQQITENQSKMIKIMQTMEFSFVLDLIKPAVLPYIINFVKKFKGNSQEGVDSNE